MSHEKKILYIVGSGRSGSTLIGNILGSHHHMVHIGEVSSIANNIKNKDLLCGCGKSFRDCELWPSVLDLAFPGVDYEHIAERLDFKKKNFTNRNMIVSLPKKEMVLERYQNDLKDLYTAIFRITNATLIIDSSKVPSYGFLVSQISSFQTFFLHLIRDPRAVTYSWNNKLIKRDDTARDDFFQEKHSLFQASRSWMVWNIAAELLNYQQSNRPHRQKEMLYESFVQKPLSKINEILDFVGENREIKAIESGKSISFEVGLNHTVWGNPNRNKMGKIQVKIDNAWQTLMPLEEKLKVMASTFPLLIKYGYLA